MTDEEIIKAFSLCHIASAVKCDNCGYNNEPDYSCDEKLSRDVYDLLNRQNKRIAELETMLVNMDKFNAETRLTYIRIITALSDKLRKKEGEDKE